MDLSRAWPEWQAVEKLGEGSYGKVYRCISEKGGVKKESAIKVISVPQNESEQYSLRSEGMTDDTIKNYFYDIVQAFTNEIHVMKALQGTKSIVSVEDYKVVERKGEIGWDIYIRMELLKSFNSYAQEQKFGETEVAKLGKDICIALEECEKRKILHRDIKPENIFVDNEGNFKIGDFGVARQLENSSTTMSQKGTYNYMAPEVVYKKKGDCRADIYSLGMVMYKLLNNNREPFVDPDKQMIRYKERVEAVEKRLNGEKLPKPKYAREEMANVILKACEFDKENRYATAAEFRQAIEKVVPTESVKKKAKANGVSGKIRLFMRMNRTKLAISALSLLLVACIVGGSVAAARYRGNKNDDRPNSTSEISINTTTEDKTIEPCATDFDNLTGLLNSTLLVGYFTDDNYKLKEYDFEKAEAYDMLMYEIFPYKRRESTALEFLFGNTKREEYTGSRIVDDPLHKFKTYFESMNTPYSGFIKYDGESVDFVVEKIFNLDMKKLINQVDLKDIVYLYEGDYYCAFMGNEHKRKASDINLEYDYDVKKDGNIDIVTLNAVNRSSGEYENQAVGKVDVECSFKQSGATKYWSIRKMTKREEDKKQIQKWQSAYASLLKDELSKAVFDGEGVEPMFQLMCIDGDDVPELKVFLGDEDGLVDLYTYDGSRIIALGSYKNLGYQKKKGIFFDEVNNAAYELENFSVKKVFEYKYNDNNYIVNGKTMNDGNLQKYKEKYMPYNSKMYASTDLNEDTVELFRTTDNLYQFGY